MAKASMDMLQLSCIQITIALLLFTQAKSTTKEISALHPDDAVPSCVAGERSALLAFRAGLSDPGNLLSSWKGDDCCRWKGVYCSNRTSHVVKLDLQGSDDYRQALAGNISSSLLGLQHLRYLDLSDNGFDKIQIPEFMGSLHQLRYLDLSSSQFIGRIPPQLGWIGEKLSSLSFLRLRSNMFHGQIPVELTKLVDLQYLDLAYNNLSGSVPRSIVNCTGMTQRRDNDDLRDAFSAGVYSAGNYLVDYTENLTVLTKGQERLYTGEIIYMVNLDFSCNSLMGEIPEEISALVALKSLNLSWNKFNGKIPENIGALMQVESLDLSHNDLSGEIPSSLSTLTSLSRLNLSYNNLRGKIPTGNQLQTLEDPASIYIGNPGLCGSPLSWNCSHPEQVPTTRERKGDAMSDMVSFSLATGSGYVMGLWVVFCTFLFKRRWRAAWYSLCDNLYDHVYVQVAVTWASFRGRING
ncbi:receptor-like protein EIX2 [Hordeum vulgare subsp. vulgare]|uniref:receptor-like protein EIX2 n=1 Tax=Hordeum vulgare subsp. vulgare TaxID=112509 RepID=UPI001D1A41AE|nr:receptor-like protein EIX2 [Hordeum vulgare subsp. vulgare]